MMSSFAPGDIVEISTQSGLAYVQLTHQHSSYPPVVRAFAGLYAERPADVQALTAAPVAFTAMIPLESALSRLAIPARTVGHVDIPAADQAFPIFRMPIRDKRGDVIYWWLWDGEGLRYDVDLDVANSDMPVREVMSAQRFLDLLVPPEAPGNV